MSSQRFGHGWAIEVNWTTDFSSLIPKMLTFTLAISCLTTSNLPWLMDLTILVPVQYCRLQHQFLHLSPVIFKIGCCFHFGSVSSFLLKLFLHWSPVAYWAPTVPWSSSFSSLSFCLFVVFMVFSRLEYWSGFPFPSPVDHALSELSTMTILFWVDFYFYYISLVKFIQNPISFFFDHMSMLLWKFLAFYIPSLFKVGICFWL